MRSRGLAISDEALAAWILETVGYYRLAGYLYPFRASSRDTEHSSSMILEEFRPGTEIAHAAALVEFDRSLRLLVLDAVERIEVAVRTRIAHVLGRHGPFAHLDHDCLSSSFTSPGHDGSCSAHTRWLDRVAERQQRSDEPFVVHFRDRYDGELPIWALTEILELGQLGRLYAGLSNHIATEIALDFSVPSKRVLASWLASVNYVRNVAAHHARLFNRKLVVAAKRPRGVPLLDHLVDKPDAKTRFGVYGTLAVMAYLLRAIGPAEDWCGETARLLDTFPTVPGVDLMSTGVTVGWRAEPLWGSAEPS